MKWWQRQFPHIQNSIRCEILCVLFAPRLFNVSRHHLITIFTTGKDRHLNGPWTMPSQQQQREHWTILLSHFSDYSTNNGDRCRGFFLPRSFSLPFYVKSVGKPKWTYGNGHYHQKFILHYKCRLHVADCMFCALVSFSLPWHIDFCSEFHLPITSYHIISLDLHAQMRIRTTFLSFKNNLLRSLSLL